MKRSFAQRAKLESIPITYEPLKQNERSLSSISKLFTDCKILAEVKTNVET